MSDLLRQVQVIQHLQLTLIPHTTDILTHMVMPMLMALADMPMEATMVTAHITATHRQHQEQQLTMVLQLIKHKLSPATEWRITKIIYSMNEPLSRKDI